MTDNDNDNFYEILIPLKWKYNNIICGKAEVSYHGLLAQKYEYKSCGLNLDCPLYKLCKTKLELNKEGKDNERRITTKLR